ncbi:bifunctional nicotinamidase/pyrazinamidase [Falsihalocynthiibacter sp. BN13B15]|uniref:bifunctional nicotinamidase/pyrazinamidase n=1 Tax=Falsihalocynthiibacter sp. BN13B15 TaxID=3240871 RepID=UPI00350E90C2
MRPANEALLVIDVQNDFCPKGALAVTDGDTIVPLINDILGQYQTRVFTQDWHPAGHASFASSHADKAPFEMIEMPYGPQVLWPDHCIQGSIGAAFHPDLRTASADVIIRKGMNPSLDSYSAFFENDHVTPTGLAGYLSARGITLVRLVGLATDYCVFYSALDAAGLGLDVEVDRAACRAIDLDGSLKAAEALMVSKGIKLL